MIASKLKQQVLILALLLVACQYSFSQAASPYSRYGLGYLRSDVFSANKGMGGLSAAYFSAVNINFANPASYASLTRTTVEIGANVEGASILIKDTSYRALNASLNHFALAFVPNARKNSWAISLGLLPYASTNYNFTQHFADTLNGAYKLVDRGKGSIYQVYLGGAYKVKGFSVGANVSYMFGQQDYEKRIILPDSVEAYSARSITNLNVKGVNYNIGLMYQKMIYHNPDNPDRRSDIYLIAGLTGSGGIKLNARVSSYWDRFVISDEAVIPVDTIQYNLTQRGKINLPVNLSGGVMFGNQRFWMVGADFRFANWASYSSPINNGQLANSWRITVGAQITPKDDDRKFFNLMQYRLGAHFGKSEAAYNGKGLNEYAGTFGFGVPFTKLARLNIAGEVGSRGLADKNAVRENYYRFTFGLVLNDAWFIKRKFD